MPSDANRNFNETTRNLLGAVFELEATGEHELKGFARPVPAWRVRGLRSVLLNYLHNICNDVGAAIEGSPKSFLQARTLLSGDGIPSRGHF
jgi:hypothetical protein